MRLFHTKQFRGKRGSLPERMVRWFLTSPDCKCIFMLAVSLLLAEGDGMASSAEGGKQMVAHCSVRASPLAQLG